MARDDIVFRALGDEWVLFDPAAHRLHVLNLSAALVWTACDGTRDAQRLAADLAKAYSQQLSPEDLLCHVGEILVRFHEHRLLL